MGAIYKITNPNGRIYVGLTKSVKHRVYAYQYNMKRVKNGRLITNSIMKYGWDKHKFEILEEVEDHSKLGEREIYWINKLRTCVYDNPRGLNMSKGGEGNTYKWGHDKGRVEMIKLLFKERGHTVPKWAAQKGKEIMMKPVLCYDTEGNFIAEYGSGLEAGEAIGVNRGTVGYSVRNKSSVAGKYFFFLKEEDKIQIKREVPLVTNKTFKKEVLCFFNNYIIEYPSAIVASIDLKIPATTIRSRALYKPFIPVANGYSFIYKYLFKQPA